MPKLRFCKSCGDLIGEVCPRCGPSKRARSTYSYKKARAARLKLAMYKCESPGCEAIQKLELHHVDGNRHNNEIENLRILCRPCHVKAGRGTPLAPSPVEVQRRPVRAHPLDVAGGGSITRFDTSICLGRDPGIRKLFAPHRDSGDEA